MRLLLLALLAAMAVVGCDGDVEKATAGAVVYVDGMPGCTAQMVKLRTEKDKIVFVYLVRCPDTTASTIPSSGQEGDEDQNFASVPLRK